VQRIEADSLDAPCRFAASWKKSGRSDTSLQGMQCVCASVGFELS
jgi:hypothetical protein